MVDRIPTTSRHAAAGLLGLLRSHALASTRSASASGASTSSQMLLSATHSSLGEQPSTSFQHTRSFSSSSNVSVSAHRKQAGREKARLRSMRMEEKILRRREKDGYRTSPSPSSPRRSKDPVEEDVESTIREYMARTGPRGERLTLAQQERLLKQELRGLGQQLEKIEKREKADEATADLPELDDQVLDELYQALMLPPPPTAEEARLARLEGGRREKSLLERGRGAFAALPPSAAEQKRIRTSMDLKQKLIHAREKGRMLLPPSAPSTSPKQAAQEVELHRTLDEEATEVDMAALPYAERQEIRLQQLFARLALTHSDSGLTGGETAGTDADSLQGIKSSLATRIAKILQDHDYELHPSVSKTQQSQSQAKEDKPSDGDENQAEVVLPSFEAVRLDGKAPSLDSAEANSVKPETDLLESDRSDLVARAESMIADLASAESRSFMLDGIERLIDSAAAAAPTSDNSSARLPLGVASIDEWTALAVASARSGDSETLARTLLLMQRAGYHPPPLSLYNDVLDAFATRGDVASCQHWLTDMSQLGLVANDHTYHSLTKAYVNSAQFLPAIELLNSLETSGRPAAMATYTMVISRLLSPLALQGTGGAAEERPELQALAWNVFYHMRLHAHPVPDAPLYALMIRACARGIPQPSDIDDPTQNATKPDRARISDAERALDLFREMTTRYSVRPNAEVYNSLILACARRKDFYLEAFRLLREMVERSHASAAAAGSSEAGQSLTFAPDRYTFNALLQGCARNRDLARARWVLAEMIRTTLPLFDAEVRDQLQRAEVVELLSKRPNEETMCHVFHTYASYVPPVKRSELQIQAQPTTRDSDTAGTAATPSADAAQSLDVAAPTSSTPGEVEPVAAPEEEETTAEEAAQIFSALVPQTASDLVSESRSLLARILADQPSPHTASGAVEGPLGGVNPGIRLVNAYLTVLAAHLPAPHRPHVLQSTLATTLPEEAAEAEGLEFGLFAKLQLLPNEHSFRIILEALADGPSSSAPAVESVWAAFEQFLASKTGAATADDVRYGRATELAEQNDGEQGKQVDAIQVKKSWCAYMHFCAKHARSPATSTTGSSDTKTQQQQQEREEAEGLDRAMATLRRFVSLYPPQLAPRKSKKARKRAVAATVAQQKTLHPSLDLSPLPLPVKSLQTLQALQAASIPGSTPLDADTAERSAAHDDNSSGSNGLTAAPTLGFLDVQLLHHRLVRYSRTKDLAYLSWVLHRYNAASRS